jgi:hypothetical protein
VLAGLFLAIECGSGVNAALHLPHALIFLIWEAKSSPMWRNSFAVGRRFVSLPASFGSWFEMKHPA